MPRGPFPHGQGAYLGRGHGGRHDLAGVIEQLPGQERHLPAATDDPAAAGEPSRARRAQELHVQVGGGREQARAQRGHQAGPRVSSSIAARNPPWIAPAGFRNCSLAVNATSIVPASGSIATSSHASRTAAGSGAARPSITSQNGPSRVTRLFLSETGDIPG